MKRRSILWVWQVLDDERCKPHAPTDSYISKVKVTLFASHGKAQHGKPLVRPDPFCPLGRLGGGTVEIIFHGGVNDATADESITQ